MARLTELAALEATPHRRWNALTREWILVSPQRNQRPWQGHIEPRATSQAVPYDRECYLCPGNSRAGGAKNPNYSSTFVFTNDFAALQADVKPAQFGDGRGLLLAESEAGTCRVVCFSPRHDLTLARMSLDGIESVVDAWSDQYAELATSPSINYVQIFENRGEIMGCSNPHPHGQIWANQTVPNEPRKEHDAQLAYFRQHGSCLLCDYLQAEAKAARRVMCENEQFVAIVPFWAIWPFEILLISRKHMGDFAGFDRGARGGLADILKRVTTRYDNLFETPFPYSMGFHPAPTDGDSHPEWHFHGHFYPPLLRSATIRKFMVGYEMLASPQRDITPEAAAELLRKCSEVHYLDRR